MNLMQAIVCAGMQACAANRIPGATEKKQGAHRILPVVETIAEE